MSANTDTRRKKNGYGVLMVGLLGLLALLIGYLVGAGRSSETTETMVLDAPADNITVTAEDLSTNDADDPRAMGDPDAPVTMIEFSDFRCPFCGVYTRQVQPQLVEEYVETGKLRIEWRDLPVFGEESEVAAVAGRAAAEQEKFWEFTEAIYADAPERGHPDLSKDVLVDYAEQVGMADLARFERDLESPELLEAVREDKQTAYEVGATGTPAFVIGETAISGAQPVENFRAVVEEELAQAGAEN